MEKFLVVVFLKVVSVTIPGTIADVTNTHVSVSKLSMRRQKKNADGIAGKSVFVPLCNLVGDFTWKDDKNITE